MKTMFLIAVLAAGMAAGTVGAAAQSAPGQERRPGVNDRMPFPTLMNTLFARQRGTTVPPPRFVRPGQPPPARSQAAVRRGPPPVALQAAPRDPSMPVPNWDARQFVAAPAPRRVAPPPPPMLRAAVPAPQRPAPARREIDPRYLPQVVDYDGGHAAGTIVINTAERHLYLVQDDGKAMRYGVGVGREGFSWRGTQTISRKAEWPDWRPPAEMRKRQPYLPAFMPGGPQNPLGARALYLGDTLYRIHGSNEPWTIGQAVSSGCIRMRNEDVIDLYGRVGIGTRVEVI